MKSLGNIRSIFERLVETVMILMFRDEEMNSIAQVAKAIIQAFFLRTSVHTTSIVQSIQFEQKIATFSQLCNCIERLLG